MDINKKVRSRVGNKEGGGSQDKGVMRKRRRM